LKFVLLGKPLLKSTLKALLCTSKVPWLVTLGTLGTLTLLTAGPPRRRSDLLTHAPLSGSFHSTV